jgi:uncharacterized repeat protein (TIGR01451 family)
MRFVGIIALVALCLAYTPAPALAVTGFDSAYASESAFVNISPGETRAFQVFFVNTGSLSWVKGTATQVDLAACLEDKVTCNAQDASEAGWNAGWLSATRYATTTQLAVAPGSIATFSYNIKAPADATASTHRFNGDLVVASSGTRIHPDGYYQQATVPAIGSTGPTTTPVTPPVFTSDLQITKTGPSSTSAGSNITYTLTAKNASGFDATNAVVTDVLPANTTFVSFSAPAGWAKSTPAVGGTGTVTARKSTFTINTSATFTLVVASNPQFSGTITNTATIRSATPDPNLTNNSATTTTSTFLD